MGTHPIFESDFDCLTENGKVKKKKNTDKIRNKEKKVKPTNPFEYKVVKTKFETLNTKIRKHQKSKPGQSRMRAAKIFDDTIGADFRKRNRKNVFVDSRINAKSKKVDGEDDFDVEKFAMEARKKMKSDRMFNTN